MYLVLKFWFSISSLTAEWIDLKYLSLELQLATFGRVQAVIGAGEIPSIYFHVPYWGNDYVHTITSL